MPIDLKMPALSPTMEEGKLARWLVQAGDRVASGEILAEIETDKATMEFEAIDEGIVAAIAIPGGTEGVKVGTVIATLALEGEDEREDAPDAAVGAGSGEAASAPPEDLPSTAPSSAQSLRARASQISPPPPSNDAVLATTLARRIAAATGVDLSGISGSGAGGRITKADVAMSAGLAPLQPDSPAGLPVAADSEIVMPLADPVADAQVQDIAIPHEVTALSSMRKVIARRLTESKQQVPHIYLTVDIRLDALLKLRAEINADLAPKGVKLSVNDLMIKALARALHDVHSCNVQFAGDRLLSFSRADISVAVSVPNGLITPIVADAGSKAVSAISAEMKDMAARAQTGRLQPHEYQGGTASLSNMGMFGIRQFDAVINPPQAMIMAVGAGEKHAHVSEDVLSIATMMSATGGFDHRVIDGADGAELMQAFRALIEEPFGLLT